MPPPGVRGAPPARPGSRRPPTTGAVGMGLRPVPPRSTPASGRRVRGTATRRPVPPTPVRPRPPRSTRSIGRRAGTRVRGGGAPAVRPPPAVLPPPAVGGRAGARRGWATRRPCPPPRGGGALTRGAPPVLPPPAVGGRAGARRRCAVRCAGAAAGGGLATLRGGAAGRGVRATVRGELVVRPPVAAGGRAGALRAGARCETAGARRTGVRWRTGGLVARGALAVRPPSPPRARARARCGSPNATSGTPTAAIPRTTLASKSALRMINSLRAPARARDRSPF